MLPLIPTGLHRAALRAAHRTRHLWRKIVRPHLRGVCGSVHDAAGTVRVVRQSYGPANWALPGGGCKRHEDPLATARRELREELALELREIVEVARIEETISGAPHTAYVMAAVTTDVPQPDGREIVEARFFASDALPRLLSPLACRRLEAWMSQQR